MKRDRRMLVTCAGCGKKFKGRPGAKRFQCSGCGNRITFPEEPRAPSEGRLLCSNCWREAPRPVETIPCPDCGQPVAPAPGGLACEWTARRASSEAAESKAGFSSRALETRVSSILSRTALARKEKELMLKDLRELAFIRRELEEKIQKLQKALDAEEQRAAAAEAGRGEALAEAERAREAAREARARWERFREAAVAVLEPLGEAFESGMKERKREALSVQSRLRNLRRRIQKMDDVLRKDGVVASADRVGDAVLALVSGLRAFRARLSGRIAKVLGGGSDAETRAVSEAAERKVVEEQV